MKYGVNEDLLVRFSALLQVSGDDGIPHQYGGDWERTEIESWAEVVDAAKAMLELAQEEHHRTLFSDRTLSVAIWREKRAYNEAWDRWPLQSVEEYSQDEWQRISLEQSRDGKLPPPGRRLM